MPDLTDTQAVIDTAIRSADPERLPTGQVYSVVVPDGGKHHLIDLDLDKYRDHPRRKIGSYVVHDPDSLAAFLDKHALPQTEVWADEVAQRITAVINADQDLGVDGLIEGPAGWGDHRATYAVLPTQAWTAWADISGKFISQEEFAEFIEDRAADVLTPSSADMLELAQSIQATVGATFERGQDVSTGQRKFEYKETVQASAGRSGQLEVPRALTLALKPFEGADTYRVTARFRFRLRDGRLALGITLERPEDVVRNAFGDIVTALQNDERVVAPIYRGAGRS